MNAFSTILAFVCVGFAIAEPPTSSYLPPQPSSSYGAPSNDLLIGAGQGYHAVGSGYQESEGANLDPQLLHKIKEILLDQENQVASYQDSHSHNFGSSLSSSYGPPSLSPVYGVPQSSSRVVGIELGHIAQGLQVAQFHQASHAPSISYGVPALPSSSYSAPSHISTSYSVPSTSYSVPSHSSPSISTSYSVPSHSTPSISSTYGVPSHSSPSISTSYSVPSHSSHSVPSSSYSVPTTYSSSALSPPPFQQSTYSAPVRRPSSLYGAPSQHATQTILLIQPRTPSLHSNYLPPSNSYLPPRHHH